MVEVGPWISVYKPSHEVSAWHSTVKPKYLTRTVSGTLTLLTFFSLTQARYRLFNTL